MFSLIITIIAIALVIVLALAGVYYGGSAYKQGQAAASAATFTLQSEQILGAAQLFRSREGAWPVDIAEMVSKQYLTSNMSIPSNALAQNDVLVPAMLIPAAYADTPSTVWSNVTANVPQFWVPSSVNEATCRTINLKARGDNGIYAQAVASLPMQCYGTGSPYTVLAQLAAPDAPALTATLPIAQNGTVVVSTPTQATFSKDPDVTTTPAPGNGTPTSDGPLTISSTSVTFGSVVSGANAEQVVTFTNSTGATVTLAGAAINGAGFSLVGSTCAAGSLAVGSSCTATVQFSPVAETAYSGTLTVHGQVVTLSGTGSAAVANTGGPMDFYPSSGLAFGDTLAGTSKSKTIEADNNNATAVTMGPPTISGTGFSIVANSAYDPSCNGSVARYDYCDVTVSFNPTTAGVDYTGVLTIHGQSVALTGRGQAASTGPVTFFPATVDFGNVEVGDTSTSQYLYVENDNSGPVALTVPVSSNPAFAFSNYCDTTLAAGNNCTVVLTYTPTAASASVAETLTIHGQTVNLTAVATAAPPATPGTFSVQAYALQPGPAKTVFQLTGGPVTVTDIQWTDGRTGAVSHSVSGITCGQGFAGPLYYYGSNLTYPSSAPFTLKNGYECGIDVSPDLAMPATPPPRSTYTGTATVTLTYTDVNGSHSVTGPVASMETYPY